MGTLLNKLLNKNNSYQNDDIVLRKRFSITNERAYDGVGTVFFDIYNKQGNRVGNIDLRLKMDHYMFYYGHIGYDVFSKYRGNNYAYKACKLLFEIAKNEYKLNELIITCNPDNIPSYKILLKLGGEFKGRTKIPANHPLYLRGEREKYVFCYKI